MTKDSQTLHKFFLFFTEIENNMKTDEIEEMQLWFVTNLPNSLCRAKIYPRKQGLAYIAKKNCQHCFIKMCL